MPTGSPKLSEMGETNRPDPPVAGDEIATLLGTLERNRATLAWKCGGLDAAGMRATLGPSPITLGGLLKHLAYVEDDAFSGRLFGQDRRPPWDTVDFKADPDWDWRSAADDSPEQLFALWQDAVDRSRAPGRSGARRRWPGPAGTAYDGRTGVRPACGASWST